MIKLFFARKFKEKLREKYNWGNVKTLPQWIIVEFVVANLFARSYMARLDNMLLH